MKETCGLYLRDLFTLFVVIKKISYLGRKKFYNKTNRSQTGNFEQNKRRKTSNVLTN
jgi:hypothetical protein